MPLFTYKAFDKRANKEVSDSLEANNQMEAIAQIKKNGLLPIEVKEAKSKTAKAAANFKSGAGSKQINIPGFGNGIKPAQITLFTRQLSTLQDAGLPIVQSLQILTDMQRPGAFKKTLGLVTEEVQSGTMLSEAMARHPKIWDKLYTNLVKAGESAGALDVILRRLSEFREKAQKLKKKVIGALIYPVAVLTIATAILSFIMIVIVPQFTKIFVELGIKMPDLTLLLIAVSEFMANYWWVALLTIVTIIFGLKWARSTVTGGAIVDRLQLRVPVLGNVVKKSSVARFTRTLGTLVRYLPYSPILIPTARPRTYSSALPLFWMFY